MSAVRPFGPTIEEAIERIAARDPLLCAFSHKRLDAARAHWTALRERGAPTSPLFGLPYGLKDLWDTAGIPSTACSHRYRDRIPERSSPVHEAFDAAGAVLVGKTSSSDLGLSVESQNYLSGITRNPIDPRRTAGGSSGGAAAAVADGMLAFDWGSDFGGSIRLPAAFCGIFGMRLSSEAWPVVGHFPMPPLSVRFMNGQGPVTRRLDLMRTVITTVRPQLATGRSRSFTPRGAFLWGPDRRDAGDWPTFEQDVRPHLAAAAGELRADHGLPEFAEAVDIARGMYSVHLEDYVECDSIGLVEAAFAAISAVAFRGRLGDRRFHPRTAESLIALAFGRVLLYRDRTSIAERAHRFKDQVAALWDRGYFLVLPTAVHPAPKHGRSILNLRLTAFTMPGNVADATGLAVPWGRFPNGLPRSLQIWGPPGSEDHVIDLAERMLAARNMR